MQSMTHSADFYLLGEVDFDQALKLQRRLVYEAGDNAEPRLVVLLCEHTDRITIGRSGSREHIRMSNEQLDRKGVPCRWVSRGGGCIPHARGQLAVYPIVPLRLVGWSVGEFCRRFQSGVRNSLQQFQISTTVRKDLFGVWGQTGLLAAVGVSVHNWTTCHGAFINVHPPMTLFHHVDTSTAHQLVAERRTMSSMLAERRSPTRMSGVRAAVVEHLAQAFECESHQVHSSHPWLRRSKGVAGEPCSNV
jgi:lipoyl(octanoyl) transferase